MSSNNVNECTQLSEWEKQMAEHAGVKCCIAFSSKANALELALIAKGIGKGDVVAVSALSPTSTSEALKRVGALPLFVDADPDTLGLCSDKLEFTLHSIDSGKKMYVPPFIKSIEQVKAIIASDTFGTPFCAETIIPTAEDYNLIIFEDVSQGLGGSFENIKAGGIGDIAFINTEQDHQCGCIFTNDEAVASALIEQRDRSHEAAPSLDELTGIVSSDTLAKEREARQQVANWYEKHLSKARGLALPQNQFGCKSAWTYYTLVADTPQLRDYLIAELHRENIDVCIASPLLAPLHHEVEWAELGYKQSEFNGVGSATACAFCLPMSPSLTESDVKAVCDALMKAQSKLLSQSEVCA
ncbi:hypothetical protein BM525_20695 (plasmid) [Alteromonas mediterranea]|uniref:Aminotransferase DegT n=1 Tax=Alteromonas mediterranea TaxID=314275 RepID=A0AAC9NTI8_9ALTE|nr:DegT/DnrJ/EryC1/StrS family aminotransferase [Alteromonas mediterranea]APD92283.1 hypothetical protein BM524_20470 [Alteromonas mediterranea]APE00144.1 hypothetical protein BM525_20695 [Alteromonas mediterranea]